MDRIHVLESEIAEIRKTLYVKEKELYELKKKWNPIQNQIAAGGDNQYTNHAYNSGILPKWAIERYSRQILLQEIGVQGQQKLCSARVLIVGAGGLGCPAAMYLAGAGVGEIGIIDYDTVDLTNIHRQILHGEEVENMNKVDSAANKLRSINSHITITPYNLQLCSTNAMSIVSKYDLVLDCTDNVPTRYLLNDVCVLNKIPLISGSALKMEGQITIYGYRDKNTDKSGPCYRCVFPSPPPAAAVGSCSANGVAGPLPGIIGAMQALEAIKHIAGFNWERLLVERMVLFDGEDCTLRTVKLRPKNPECAICSPTPTITQLVDYEAFCKAQAKEKDLDLKILPPENRYTALELAKKLNIDTKMPMTDEKRRHLAANVITNTKQSDNTQGLDNARHLAAGDGTKTVYNEKNRHLLVDVRSEQEFLMCNISGSVNYPIEKFDEVKVKELAREVKNGREVTFLCRRGNDSQEAAERLINIIDEDLRSYVKDLTGGLHAWAKSVDRDFPIY